MKSRVSLRERPRWAVEVRHYHGGRLTENSPFLAGRYYFDAHEGADARSERDDQPPIVTFDTRAAALRRCRMIRFASSAWRTTARPIKVRVLVQRVID